MSKDIRKMIDKVKNFKQFVNEEKYNYDLTKSDPDYINRENNKEIIKKRDENKYTQDEFGTKTERFG